MDQERVFEGWTPNFVEAVACAMSENVYSAALAWLLSTGDLPAEARVSILRALAHALPENTTIRHAEREWRDIDVLVHVVVEGKPGVVAIENKIKAIEHSQQLTKYDRALAEAKLHAHTKVFLTLLGTAPVSGNRWEPARYRGLLAGLHRAKEIEPRHRYLEDFTSAVARLAVAIDLVVSKPTFARIAFGEVAGEQAPGFAHYVSRAGLSSTLGQAWMAQLGRLSVGDGGSVWSIKAAETHGEPLVNIERVVELRGVAVNMGLQLQNWRLQAFAEPHPYKDVKNASAAQRAAVDACIESMKDALALPQLRRSGPPKAKYHRGLPLGAEAESFDAARWAEVIKELLPRLETIPGPQIRLP